MDYNHKKIESRWQQYWKDNKVYHTEINHDKPKFYVLDMFPILRERGCMWDIRSVTSPATFLPVTNV